MSEGALGLRRRRVRPFPLSELPRILQVQVDLSRALWRHLSRVIDALASSAAAQAALSEVLSSLSLSFQEPYLFEDSGAAARVQGGQVVELELLGPSPRRALLAVDEALVATLGGEGEEALAVFLARVLSGIPVRVGGLVAPREVAGMLCQPGQMLLGMDIQLRGPSGAFWSRLLLGADLRLAAAPPLDEQALGPLWHRRDRLAGVTVALRIEAGQGLVRGEEVAKLEAGDILVLDRFGPRPVVGGPVRLRLGRGAFSAHLDGNGLTLMSPFQLQGPAQGSTSMGKELPVKNDTKSDDRNDESADRLLRELPVQLTCELGRITLSGRELLELRPGAVLPIGRPLSGPVDLCAGERLIARGELVDVEGEIGIRVTEILD